MTEAEIPLPREQSDPLPKWGLAVIALGFVARFVLAYISWGSNDASTWQDFGRHIAERGILWVYHNNKDFNHPPLPGYWGDFVYRMTGPVVPIDARHLGFTFPFLFKLPDILADAVTCWLLWKILSPRRGATFAVTCAALFALSPNSILLTSHHCNTDPIYIMLILLTLWLIEDRGRDFWGGLALAAAINVKLIPILFILPLLGTYHEWRRAWRFFIGLSIGVIPFIPVLIGEGRKFYYHAIAYGSAATYWGINFFLIESLSDPHLKRVVNIIGSEYYVKGRWLIIAAVLLMTLRATHEAVQLLHARRRNGRAFYDPHAGFWNSISAVNAPPLVRRRQAAAGDDLQPAHRRFPVLCLSDELERQASD